jgi:hypothetical protein
MAVLSSLNACKTIEMSFVLVFQASPPVPQSKIEELMGYIFNRMLNSIKERNKRQATSGVSHNFAIVAKFYGIYWVDVSSCKRW